VVRYALAHSQGTTKHRISMTDQRDSFAREIDEELRREQLLKLWEKYGTYIIAVAALLIVGVGGVKYYQHRNAVAASAAGAQLASAARNAEQDRASEAQKALENLSKSGPAGYSTLARLRLAAADREAGKAAEAITAYEAIAKDANDPLLADYARLQAASLKLDTADWTDMQNRLNDLAGDTNVWRSSARELLGLAALKAGQSEEARQQFQRLLGDQGTPPSIAERARIMMAMLTEAELAGPATAPSSTERSGASVPGETEKSN
jgi:hypothetical protein